jgi:hypothetical protein
MLIECCASVQYAFYDDDEQWNFLANFVLALTSLDPIFFFFFPFICATTYVVFLEFFKGLATQDPH